VENGFIDIDKSQRQHVRFTVDINKDPWPAIANLPGIGEQLARQIVDHRQKHGPFAEHAELIQVRGIGPAKLKKIQSMLTPIGAPTESRN
jgi:competence ComEA-like helix-hairpin-helix protein